MSIKNRQVMGVVHTRGLSFTLTLSSERGSTVNPSGRVLMSALSVSVSLRELELQRKSSATDIAKKKQEAESAVSAHWQKHSYSLCVGIIDHCL